MLRASVLLFLLSEPSLLSLLLSVPPSLDPSASSGPLSGHRLRPAFFPPLSSRCWCSSSVVHTFLLEGWKEKLVIFLRHCVHIHKCLRRIVWRETARTDLCGKQRRGFPHHTAERAVLSHEPCISSSYRWTRSTPAVRVAEGISRVIFQRLTHTLAT